MVLAIAGCAVSSISCWSTATAEPALDAATRDRLRPVVPAALEYYAERSDDPLPALGHDEVEELLAGKVVRKRRHRPGSGEDPPERVTGFRIVALPRAQVWVAALDPDFQATDILTECRLKSDDTDGSVWHQYLHLPWPLADRQWVIRVHPELGLATATDNLVWEQSWSLVPGGEELARTSIASGQMGTLTPESTQDAVYIPANEGSWVLFQLEEGMTLVVYRVVVRVGGSIPDSWITGLGMAQLTQLLNGVCTHAQTIPATYDPTVHAIAGGDGSAIPAWSSAAH